MPPVLCSRSLVYGLWSPSPALRQGAGKGNGAGSAAVPGRIDTTTDLAPVSITQIRRPIIDRLGAAKNGRAPARAGKGNGARERGRP
ncbi:MAG TPA: hypothetical protein PLW35_14290, partial [Verrucomicrobiota bacterium]|nr:hypothetical protein [Verrucomicrobiota bacterium]